MATNMLGTLLEAALFLEEVDKLSSQSDFSSSPNTTTTSSTASSPSTTSPTSLHRPSSTRQSDVSPSAAPSWAVKMSATSPTIILPASTTTPGGLSPQTPGQQPGHGRQRGSVDGMGQVVVSTNQSQYPTAKAVSLSVANLPQQTAAIPLVIGQQQSVGASSVSISASTKYGYQQPTATLLNSINQTAVLSSGGNGFQLTASSHSSGAGSVQTYNGTGITRIVDSSGNILHLPSGTAAAAVNSNSSTTYSTMVRVSGNGSVDNSTEERFDNDSLPPSLVVISPQNFAGHYPSQSHHPHHGQTISIIPGPVAGGRENTSATGMDLSNVDFVHSANGSAGTALSSNQKSTNTLEVTMATSSGNRSKQILVNQPVFVNRTTYSGLVDQTPKSGENESIMKSTNMVSGKILQQPMLANSLLGPGSLHFQHTMPADKPEDLSSHLTYTANGYGPSPVGVESVNNILSNTTGSPTTLVGAAPKPVLNLRDLSIDPQQPIYDIVYQKGVLPPATTAAGTSAAATATGRRRTISNNSTGGSQRSPSSMRSGTRESHNKLEKNRRAQMRNCFEQLKKELPKGQEEKKTSNLSILSNALNYITTLKRTEKEWEHELERLVKVKIGLQNKIAGLKREMATQLDKDPALAALVTGEIPRSVRHLDSGAEEASSMDGYPSNGDETDSFRSSSIVERSMSPLLISSPINGKVQQLSDPVSVEVKPRNVDHLSTTTIVAVPNLNLSGPSQLPVTAINLSSASNPNNHAPNGVLNIPMNNNNGFNKGTNNGLVIKEAAATTTTISAVEKVVKLGNGGELLEPPPAKLLKLVNGNVGELTSSQGTLHQHTQVLPIYSSTQNGGLRVIGHHTTTTTSTGSNGTGLPTSVVFTDPTSKYQHHLPSGMVISAPMGGTLPANLSAHPYMTNSNNTSSAQVHKLLLTGMGSNMMAQSVPTTYTLPQLSQQAANEMFPRGSTSLPGGAQLNLCRSPSSTPSPTISMGGKGNNGSQMGGRTGTQINTLSLTNGTSLGMTLSSTANGKGMGQPKDPQNWNPNSASPHSFVPFQMVATPPAIPVVSLAGGVSKGIHQVETAKPPPAAKAKRAPNGNGRGSKRKNNQAAVMITPQTSMEPVKSSPLLLVESKSNGEGTGVSASITLSSSRPTIK